MWSCRGRVRFDGGVLVLSLIVCIGTHMTSREVIAALKASGWLEVGQTGSHIQFKQSTRTGRVTVPHPKKDLPLGTLRSIDKQSGLKLR
jgi:predicted RNA binding protein YcfA (HicA-like mRNA interferase family)